MRPSTRYTEQEKETVSRLLGRMSLDNIALRINRTTNSLQKHLTRYGIPRHGEWYSATQAAEILGMCPHTVRFHIYAKHLSTLSYRPPCGNCGGAFTGRYMIGDAALKRFLRMRIDNASGKDNWTWRKMPRGYYREYAEEYEERTRRKAVAG